MPVVGDHDAFETQYTSDLVALLARHGLPVQYSKDRATVDAAVHIYVEGSGNRQVSHTRVWFQAKGKRTSTLSAELFRSAGVVDVRVPVDHLRFWYATPEAVYLVVYVEAVDQFLAEDVRDIVERMWPNGDFYSAVPESQRDVTVHVRCHAPLDTDAFKRMLSHRSIRADGPAFRGRPLGHRLDPIRSEIEACDPDLFERIVSRLLDAHGYRQHTTSTAGARVTVWDGTLHQTFEWQSPVFAEYGYDEDSNGMRIEPPVEYVHGDVTIVIDSERRRTDLSPDERTNIGDLLAATAGPVLVVFNGEDMSATGGLWRAATRDAGADAMFVGLESVTSALLVATLVYLEFAPEIRRSHVNYRDDT